jgi:hypothetical protein
VAESTATHKMTPEEEKFKKHIQRLDELSDRMLKAGLIVRHAHTEHGSGVVATASGILIVEAFWNINKACGPLTNTDKILIWDYLCALGDARKGKNN